MFLFSGMYTIRNAGVYWSGLYNKFRLKSTNIARRYTTKHTQVLYESVRSNGSVAQKKRQVREVVLPVCVYAHNNVVTIRRVLYNSRYGCFSRRASAGNSPLFFLNIIRRGGVYKRKTDTASRENREKHPRDAQTIYEYDIMIIRETHSRGPIADGDVTRIKI